MKKILCTVLMTVLYLLIVIPCHAQNDIVVYVNGKQVFFDQPPTIIDGRTLVPARAISEMFNANVSWDENTKTATITKEFEKSIVTNKVQIGDNKITTEELQFSSNKIYDSKIELDVPATIINGRTMLPLRSMSFSLFEGCIWNANTRTIYLGKNPLSSSVGLSDTVISDIKASAISIVKNALKNPYSATFSSWEIQRYVNNGGYWIYCTVKSTEGTDYMCFSFDEKDSFYQCKSANASTTEYYDNTDVFGTARYLFTNGEYMNLDSYFLFNPNNCMPIVTKVYDTNAKTPLTIQRK